MLILLMQFVQNRLDEGLSLNESLRLFAKQNSLTEKSVTKCFRQTIASVANHKNLAKHLGIDLVKLLDPANAYNVSAVHNYVLNSNKNLHQCIFSLCMGDEMIAKCLLARYKRFYPEEVLPTKKSEVNPTLLLQAKYCQKPFV